MSKIKCTPDCEIEVRPALFGRYYAGCPKHNNFARTMPTEEAAKREWRRWLVIDGKVKAKGIEQ
jgi:hypothetical protein